jgi:hypothetical protein
MLLKKNLYLCSLEAAKLVMIQSILDVIKCGYRGSEETETFRLLIS